MGRIDRYALLWFVVANVVGVGLVAAAHWLWMPDAVVGQRRHELARVWLPVALAIAALLSAVVAAAQSAEHRRAFLLRHCAFYAVGPASLLAAHVAAAPYGGLLRGIYVALVVGVVLHALEGIWRAPTWLADRHRAALLGAVVLAANLMLVPPLMRGMYPTADEPHYLLTAQSLVLDGDVDLRNDYTKDRYSAFYPGRLPDIHGIEVGPAIYPIRDLGLPVVIAPSFAVAGRYGVLAFLGVLGALFAVQLYLLLRDLAFGARTALLATSAAVLTHPLLTYATQIYPDLVIALLVVSALRLLGRGRALRPPELATVGALAGLLLFFSARAWVLALALLALASYWALRPAAAGSLPARPRRPAALAAVVLPFFAVVAPVALLNGVLFGLPIPGAGYWLVRDQHDLLGLGPHVGALGLLFDRTFGLVGRAPIYLVAFAGIVTLYRKANAGHGPLVAALALAGLVHFAFVANLAYWHSHWSPPSRNLIAAAPLLVAALAGGIEILSRSRPRWLGAALGGAALAWSALITVAYTIRPRLRYDLPEAVAESGSGELWRFVAQVTGVDPGRLFPSAVALDSSTYVLGALWAGIAALIGLAAARQPRSLPA